METRCCKVCGRSFPSGRSLGGHMRSHVLLSSSLVVEEKPMCAYGLRENPRKVTRFGEKEKKKLCIPSSSRSSQFEHKRCDYVKKEEDAESRGCYEMEEDEAQSQSDSEVTALAVPARKQAKLTDSSPECEDKEKIGALCLLLLSRGAAPASVTNSSEKVSVGAEDERSNSSCSRFDFGTNETQITRSLPPESVSFPEFKSSKASPFDSAFLRPGKRSRYECKACNRSFHSYQALGGHMANHRKIKEASFPEIHSSKSTETLLEKSLDHECSICGKVFKSGQSLGGHKRSHIIAGNNAASASASASVKASLKKPSSLDLNLPAPDEESLDNPNGSIEYWI